MFALEEYKVIRFINDFHFNSTFFVIGDLALASPFDGSEELASVFSVKLNSNILVPVKFIELLPGQ